MKKSAFVFLFTAVLSVVALAQSIQEGMNYLYAERNQSAKTTFEKMVAANPNNIEANYWLGQTYIAMGDVAGARNVYQKAAAASNNAPLIRVGMGHVLLLENKPTEARAEFEAAITASHGRKGNDPNILNAVGRANVSAANSKVKSGDINYAIEKLTEASQLAPNNTDILLNLGNAYFRTPNGGGQAVTAYTKATQINPKFAPAYYRMARIYNTQKNWEIYTRDLNSAIQADPTFAPAYYELYYYNLPRDLTVAEDYANKFIANTDPSPENEYLKAQTLFQQKKYNEAIASAKGILSAAGNNVNPRVYRLLGYSYLETGDTATAKQYVDQLFAKASDEDLVAADYLLQAYASSKDDPSSVKAAYEKVVKMDTVVANQITALNEGIKTFQESGQKRYEADLRALKYSITPNPNPAELFFIGKPYYDAGAYPQADSIFKLYIAAFPDSIFGYMYDARTLAKMDTSMTNGTAVDAYKKLLDVSATDKVRYRSTGLEAANYLAGYAFNIQKDRQAALDYFNRGLEFDPTNAAILNNIKIIQNLNKPAPAATPPAKTKTTATKTKTKG